MPYENIDVQDCIKDYILYDLAFICDGDLKSVELTEVESD